MRPTDQFAARRVYGIGQCVRISRPAQTGKHQSVQLGVPTCDALATRAWGVGGRKAARARDAQASIGVSGPWRAQHLWLIAGRPARAGVHHVYQQEPGHQPQRL
jgi:hypothetical protein